MKIAIDTNILVRFLVEDDEVQARQAKKLIENNSVIVPLVVLIEAVWVLESSYGFAKNDIIDVLRQLLESDIEVQNFQQSIEALNLFEKNSADFSDWLVYTCSKQLNAEDVYTFDKKCLKSGYFKKPQ